ncbi:MAG: glycosyltransferase family 4 protein [Phycisphaerae bacterium]
MRVLFMAAGAGGMFCGSCLRDNRLAAGLIAEGKDVSLWPMYTPIMTDEKVVGSSEVHFGGLGVYLEQVLPIFRRHLGPIDRLLRSTALLRMVGMFSSSTTPESLGPLTVSILKGPDGNQRKELEDLVRDLKALSPDIINLPNLMFVGLARTLKAELGCKIVCTLSGEDIFLDRLPQPHRKRAFSLIADAARDVDAYVSVTEYFANEAREHFSLPGDRLHVIAMGIDVDAFAAPDRKGNDSLTIGYFARICEEKGLKQLAEAFVALRKNGVNASLKISGYLGRSDRKYFHSVMRYLRRSNVEQHVQHIESPTFEEKVRFLGSLDVLCVPSIYREAKGFYVLEALACGVPVVLPAHGSFPEMVERTGGGLLFKPNDMNDLQRQIVTLANDVELRRSLGNQGKAAVANHYSASLMRQRTWSLFETLVKPSAASTTDA